MSILATIIGLGVLTDRPTIVHTQQKPTAQAPKVAPVSQSTPQMSPLKSFGTDIVDANQKRISLRGVNLGGWLVEEIWMTPWKAKESETAKETVRDHTSLYSLLQTRLGRENALAIKNAWRENWITEEDFAKIKATGANHVRIPFLHSLLDERGGIERLLWAVATAKKNQLYVVLDMHGTPGGQSNEHHTGTENRNRLWFDVENIAEMERKWTLLATRFKNEPTVAMYDIMNEPMGAPNPAMLHLVYDRIIRTIRKVDPSKIVVVDDGYKGFETTPHPNLAQWQNVVYSLHFYHFDAKAPGDHLQVLEAKSGKIKELQGYRSAPLYIGEFQLEPQFSPSGFKSYVEKLDQLGWSWSVWTWKACGAGGPVGQWGMVRPTQPIVPLDPFQDSKETLIEKIKKFRTENWTFNPSSYPFGN